MQTESKHWTIDHYTKEFLKEVKNGDTIKAFNCTWNWIDELDRPQKMKKDSTGKVIGVELDYGE